MKYATVTYVCMYVCMYVCKEEMMIALTSAATQFGALRRFAFSVTAGRDHTILHGEAELVPSLP